MAAGHVRVFNETLLEGLVADNPEAQISGQRNEPAAMSASRRSREQQKQHLKDLEELRQRRYDRNRMEAKAKSAESDRKVFFPLLDVFTSFRVMTHCIG